jgi:hypothetical protein
MDKNTPQKFPGRSRLVDSGSVFAVSIFVAIVTIVFIWVLGLGTHRTLFVNSILSVSVLSVAFLIFIVSGLYRGIKLKDSVGRLTDKFRFRSLGDFWQIGEGTGDGMSSTSHSGGCLGDLGEIFLWILLAIVAIILIWLLGHVLWFLILVFVAMLYWIFFRALRFIFKKSARCKGNFGKSLWYGLYHTILYNFWIYGIVMGAHYFIHR